MTLRRRLFLLVTTIIAIGLPSAAGVFAYVSWQSVLQRTESEGTLIAQTLAQSVTFIQQVPTVINQIVDKEVLTQADMVAQLTQLALRKKASAEDINHALRTIAANNDIPEIWVTDGGGNPRFWSLDDIDASIAGDSGLTSRPAFKPLLQGQQFRVSTDLLYRPLDQRALFYGAVALPDRQGMALIARLPSRANRIIHSIGLKRMVETVLAAAQIDTIWIFDENLEPLAATSDPRSNTTTTLSEAQRSFVETVISTSAAASYLEDSNFRKVLLEHAFLYVAAPIFGADGLPNGAALMRLPVNMRAEMDSLLTIGGGVTVALLLLGMLLALPFLNRIVRPLSLLTVQTHRLVAHNFDPDEEMHAELLKISENRKDEVGYLGNALYSMVTTLKTYIADLKATTAAKERIEGEMSAARDIQMGMLPRVFGSPLDARFDLHAVLEPAKAVGGDLFDFFPLDERRLFFLIGDVSDKGVPAALFMAVTKTLFTVEAKRDSSSVAGIMERVNRSLCENNPEGMFVTVFAAIIDLDSGEISCSDGGHELPFVLRCDGAAEMLEKKKGGLVLGFVADTVYRDDIIRLQPGEALVLYTDGVTEAMNSAHELFKEARLGDTLATVAPACAARTIIDQVIGAVRAFVGQHPQSDDITLLALRWHGRGDSELPATQQETVPADASGEASAGVMVGNA
ncbi:PP2C family protein-serine/threonine phosphatase [Accumulibacter sp.]|uniref:PP2C family protein-serine/threonine phosphatase n=1 Tax=Accumulibacter sp. TaxID=2053492 RepID=UPI0028C4D1CB|nr:PP2C family protein-serine/threonine phosphatase [Accumulibacter sp.]